MKISKLHLIFSISVIVIAFVSTLVIGVSFAWFTDESETVYQGEMGFVDVDLDIYFDDGQGGRIEAEEVEIVPGTTKPGVYRVNITSNTANFFIEDLRVDIIVKSNIETYFRVKIYEQLTFIYTDSNNLTNELAVLYAESTDLNYNFIDWYDNQIFDNYFYYQNRVERIDENTPLVISLIESYYTNQSFNTRSPGYSLQMAFSIEAVQAEGGPENVWDYLTPPWGGSW